MLKRPAQEGAFRELAEPNLIAMNGQQASFLAGGEFPVPVLQGGSGGNRHHRSFGKNMAFA
jgi:pilus assembly protein CpaC